MLSHEIQMLLDSDKPTTHRLSYTFGVEIECGVERGEIGRAASSTGMQYQYEGYNHNDNRDHFKFVRDASLRLDNAIECVSPVLKGKKGKDLLKLTCDTLNNAGAKVNKTCGLHVHIGADKLTQTQYCNVFINYMHLEPVIDCFMARSRRCDNNGYCMSLKRHSFDLASLRVPACENDKRQMLIQILHNSRYYKVNPLAYERHHTIEFRQHQGTTDYTKIINWVNFCAKLVEYSKNNNIDRDITTIDEIPFLNDAEKSYFKQRIIELN